jgi:hypothetical protein
MSALTKAERYALAEALGWTSCGDCVLDDCCGAYDRVGFRRCTKPHGHSGSHVVCTQDGHRTDEFEDEPAPEDDVEIDDPIEPDDDFGSPIARVYREKARK